jgi:hypothetical protein
MYKAPGALSRWIHFGDNRYQQYKDSTGLGVYSSKDHLDPTRRSSYFFRHSGVDTKKEALALELKKSKGKMTAKILSHKYLW